MDIKQGGGQRQAGVASAGLHLGKAEKEDLLGWGTQREDRGSQEGLCKDLEERTF